jgi:hypothetical protein
VDKRKEKYKSKQSLILEDIEILNEILRSIFRQGSGLIPSFVAESFIPLNKRDSGNEFTEKLTTLLKEDFNFVLSEIDDILIDFDKIVEKNFDNKNKIRYNLIQQLPVLGASGHHKRDIRKTAIQFRMPGYPYVLIATDILKEGEDLHSYCKNIYHYGIAWNPSDMEQRTGRIDRIDSLAYREIKQFENSSITEIPFEKRLQVFYPYLSDTLEVNQMAKLFNDMNVFIDIFYNDLSVKLEKDSKVKTDSVISSISPQKTGLLQSKYDVDQFKGSFEERESLKIKDSIGNNLASLQYKIQEIQNLIILQKFKLGHEPTLDLDDLRISGILNIRNYRQGPFELNIVNSNIPGEFMIQVESCLGSLKNFNSSKIKEAVNLTIKKIESKYDLKFSKNEKKSYVWLSCNIEFNKSPENIIKDIIKMVYLTDRLEQSIFGTDENIDDSLS